MTMRTPQFHEPAPSGRHYRRQQVIALPVFGVALSLYVLTLSPTVITPFDDSLEFQLVTYQLGIAHPTGYPLYTLLGWLFTRLPVGDVAYRVNLMSAVFGALAVALVYLIGLECSQDNDERQLWPVVVAALVGAFALAVSPVFWSQATVAEVYTLNAAFVAAILLWLVRKGRYGGEPTALAFLFGLSLTHHRTMLLLLPAIVFYGWRLVRQSGDSSGVPIDPRRTGKLAAALVAPLLLYLCIPLRGHVGSLDGTYANTLAGFWRQVTASGYGAFIFTNPFGTERGVDLYLTLFLRQFGWVGIAFGLVGFGALRRPGMRNLTGIAFASYLVFNLFYRVADIQVFFIPPFLIWAIWIGAGVGWLWKGLESRSVLSGLRSGSIPWPVWADGPGDARLVGRALCLGILLLFVGQSVVLLQDNLPQLNRSGDWVVHDYGLDVMRQPLEPRAVIVGILGETTLVRYFQATEGLRSDLLLVAADRESDRLATVARLLDEGRSVYLTRELAGAPARWSLSAVGPLIRVNPQPIRKASDVSFVIGSPVIPEITLYGYTISRPPAHSSPPPVRLTLIWQVTAPVTRELKVSARLLNSAGQPVAQTDAVPVHFAYPTTAWRSGEFITDVYDLVLPTRLPPGDYVPLIILYDPAQGAAEVGRLTLVPVTLQAY